MRTDRTRAEDHGPVGRRLLGLIEPDLCATSGWTARDAALDALRAGVRAFVLRPPRAPRRRAAAGRGVPPGLAAPAPLRTLACELRARGALVIGHAGLSWEMSLDGLHLPAWLYGEAVADRSESPIWSASVHDFRELEVAHETGAQRVLVSPYARTKTKPGYEAALGFEGLKALCERATIPVLALGGVDARNVCEVAAAGAAGVAVLGPLSDQGRSDERDALIEALWSIEWQETESW